MARVTFKTQTHTDTHTDSGKCVNRELSDHLEPAGQKLVLDLQEVPSAHLPFEGLIQDGKPHIILHILPPSIAVSESLGSSVTTSNFTWVSL